LTHEHDRPQQKSRTADATKILIKTRSKQIIGQTPRNKSISDVEIQGFLQSCIAAEIKTGVLVKRTAIRICLSIFDSFMRRNSAISSNQRPTRFIEDIAKTKTSTLRWAGLRRLPVRETTTIDMWPDK
jgi:hypothetical protein